MAEGERQRIVRLLVKEVIVGSKSITIRHCLPIAPATVAPPESPAPAGGPSGGSSLLVLAIDTKAAFEFERVIKIRRRGERS